MTTWGVGGAASFTFFVDLVTLWMTSSNTEKCGEPSDFSDLFGSSTGSKTLRALVKTALDGKDKCATWWAMTYSWETKWAWEEFTLGGTLWGSNSESKIDTWETGWEVDAYLAS